MQRQDLFSAFEGLGNNCEFGFVQDAAGCGGLSLFKNVGFDATEQIIDAIDADFAGMFEDGAFDFIVPNGWPDYALDCRRFGFRFHTGMPHDIPNAEAQFETLLRAFRFLREKLLRDLREGTKVFTYRHQVQFNEPLAERLAASIRRHGPGWLLWVRMDDRPDRCFAWVEPSAVEGLLYGGMPYLVTDSPPRVAYDAWEQIARKALALRRGEDKPPPPINGSVRRLLLNQNVQIDVAPGLDLVAHTWVWLTGDFTGSALRIVADGAVVGQGQAADLSRQECWQAVWAAVRVAADRRHIALSLSASDAGHGLIYTTGWTVRRMRSPNQA
jgi:hypothetical protein